MNERYLTSFEDQTSALSYTSGTTLASPQVSLIGTAEVVYSKKMPNESKIRFAKDETTGKLYFVVDVEGEETDLTAGYVDLGLSVMWASCDVGATSPEGEGTKYAWGEESWETIPMEFDPVYMNSDMEWKEALQPRTPSPTQVKELLDNTTATEEVLNGVSGVRYTASNGNSIFVSNAERWTNAMKYLVTSYYKPQAACWNNSGIIDNMGGNPSGYSKTQNLLFRGICNYIPKGDAKFIDLSEPLTVSSDKLYCLSRSTEPVYILSSIPNIEMYVSKQPFNVEDSLYTYSFREDNGSAFGLTSGHLSIIQKNIIDDYIYIKFSEDTTITLSEWNASACVKKSIPIYPNEPFTITKDDTIVYRFKYSDYEGYGFVLKWANTFTGLPTYVADTCTFGLTSGDSHVIKAVNIREGGQMTIKPDVYSDWASRVGADGYLYVRFDSNRADNVTFVCEKPV